jgi:RHS repeat-associated protein
VNNNNRITNTGFRYDASGDLTSDGVNNYTWNAEALTASANSVNYTHDGDRKRVKKSNGTLYWYGPSGEVLEETDLSGNLLHDYIYFGGKRIARQDGTGASTVYYYFQDHLGTALMMVDAWGHIQQQSVYYPFGGERVITNNVANNYKFTGLERDSETGLDHTLNLQYSSTLGRWLSPDPVRGCVMNPQKFDRYSYVVNNPITLIDPTGLDPRRGGPRSLDLPSCPEGKHAAFDWVGFFACLSNGGQPLVGVICYTALNVCIDSIEALIASGGAVAPITISSCVTAAGFCGWTIVTFAGCIDESFKCASDLPRRSGRRGPYVDVPAGGDSGSLFGLDAPPGDSGSASAGDDVGPGSGWCPSCAPPVLTPRGGS